MYYLKRLTRSFPLLAFLFGLWGGVATHVALAQSHFDENLVVTVEQSEALAGETDTLSIYVEMKRPVSFSSFEVVLGGFHERVDFSSVTTLFSLTQDGWTYRHNNDLENGQLHIAASNSSSIQEPGILFNVEFSIPGDAYEEDVPVNILEVYFNEDLFMGEVYQGGISISGGSEPPLYGDVDLNGVLELADVELLLAYLSGSEEITFTEEQRIQADVTFDGTLSPMDASAIRMKLANMVDKLPLSYDLIPPDPFAEMHMDHPERVGADPFPVSITMTQLNNVMGMKSRFVYDPMKLSLDSVIWHENLAEFTKVHSMDTGSVYLAAATHTAHSDSSLPVADLFFSARPMLAGDSTEITMRDGQLNENPQDSTVISTTVYGTQDIISLGDVNGDGTVDEADVLMILNAVVGAADLDSLMQVRADVTLDGLVTGMDASALMQFGSGVIDQLPITSEDLPMDAAAGLSISNNIYELSEGDTLSMGVILSEANNVYAISGEVHYSGNLMAFDEAELNTDLGEFIAQYRVEGNTLYFALAVPAPISTSLSYLGWFGFNVSDTLESDYSFEVELTNFRLNQGEIIDYVAGATISITGIEDRTEALGIPQYLELKANYPNPFNPSTTIGFGLPESGNVRLEVYDLTGRKVAMLVNEFMRAGTYQVNFDATGLASGMYVYRLETKHGIRYRQMTLVK